MGLLEQLKATQEQLRQTQELLVTVIADTEIIVTEAEAHGFSEGVASRDAEVKALKDRIAELEGNNDKIYTQADLDNAVKAAVDPLQMQIDGLKAQIASMQEQLDAVPGKLKDAEELGKSEEKSEIKGKLDEFEAKELA